MVYITKFRVNDLAPSKGKQIEFNAGIASKFFGFGQNECTVTFECRSFANDSFKKTISVYLKLSPERGDYKIYQNPDGSLDLKDVFLSQLHLTAVANADDYYAIRKKTSNQYVLYYVPKDLLFSRFFPAISGDQILTADDPTDSLPQAANLGAIQVITYGAPGTGKSHETKTEIAGKTWFRTTFHPDSDYASFVGTYKPTMREDGVALTEVSQKDAAGQLVGTEIHDQRKGIAYGFVDQVFAKAYVEAWRRQKKAAAGTTPEPVYLVIEEINRGNCAQVFGDIFQLLDRKSAGFSEYSIEPDADLGRFIGKEIAKETATIDAARKAQINALYPEATFDVVDEVLSGNRLLLPDNFFIRATMNTSDQSLFPMDSAFKRRWDWKYVPIKDAGKGWKIKFGDCEVDWWKFLVEINKIVKGVTNSADKQLGYFFVKAKDSVIDAEMFVNKVAFYLWNDVFKDCELDGEAFKIEREGGEVDVLAFQDFFKEDGTINEEVLKNFLTKLVPQPETASGGSEAGPAADGEA